MSTPWCIIELMRSGSKSLAADGTQLRMLHLHAHPDDESSKGAATTAKYVAEGARVMIATFTGGERGSVLNEAMDRPEVWANITEIRKQEMALAQKILGAEHVELGFEDSGLPEGDPMPPLPEDSFATYDPEDAAHGLVKLLREFRPHVVTTYDEAGGYPHPDHIQCHRVSVAALKLAADKNYAPELGPVWKTPKIYYQMGMHRAKYAALSEAMEAKGMESPYAHRLADWQDYNYEHRITTRVRCEQYFPVRDNALRAHATQVDPHGAWFAVPRELEKQVWPTEDWQLVYSSVPTKIPENDLFEGLRPEGEDLAEPRSEWIV